MHDDLSVFFVVGEFAMQATRTRASVADVSLAVIVGEQDENALEGRALAPERVAAFQASADVLAGDMLTIAHPTAGNVQYRVREVHRVNDGAEARAWLRKVSP